MPIGTIKTYKGALSEEQKVQLHKEFADMMVRIEGKGNENLRKHVILTIEEEELEDISFGGLTPTREILNCLTN